MRTSFEPRDRDHTHALGTTHGLPAIPIGIVVVLVAVGLLTWLVGCDRTAKQGATTSPPPPITSIDISLDELLDNKFVARNVTLAVGETLKVILASNPSTGFQWTADAKIGDPAVIKQTGHENVAPNSSLVGAGGAEIWTFVTLKRGTSAVTTDYNQPWPGGTKKAWTFKANVTVL